MNEEINKQFNVKFETKNNLILENFKDIWVNNGDYISLQYCGTKSNISNVTKNGKRGITGYLFSYKTTIDRFLNATTTDNFKQECINCLLQLKEFYSKECTISIKLDELSREIEKKLNVQFSKLDEFTIFCGTFNLGGNQVTEEEIKKFIYPNGEVNYDIIIINFQRIFDLNLKKYFQNFFGDTSKSKIEFLMKTIEETLSKSNNKYEITYK